MAYPTSFKEGNQAAKKSPKIVIRKFNEMMDLAKNDDSILCFQDAYIRIGWRSSKIDYWINKLPVFGNIKKDIQQIIISRINRGTLTSKYNSTGGIWRMKQLGETDSQTIDNKSSDGSMSPQPIVGIRFKDE